MKILLSITALVLFGCSLCAQLTPQSAASANAPGGSIYFYQYKPPHYNNTDLFPLIISLHGVGQAGDVPAELSNVLQDGLPKLVNEGLSLEFTWQGNTEGFVMLVPQCNRNDVNSWPTYYIDEMVSYGIANLRVDPNRVFLTGFSAGGGGVWKYATSSAAAAAKLAGIVPVASSFAGITDYCNIGSQKVAVWTFHGGADLSIPSHIDRANVVNVNNCSPVIPAVDTIYGNEGHGIYMSVAYNATNFSHYPNVFQWMLKVNKGINPATNQSPVPVITGGNSIVLTAPVKVREFPILDGSASTDDDIIMDYLWTQTGGAATLLPSDGTTEKIRQFPTVQVPLSSSVGVPVGSYSFSLRVKDYLTSKPGHTQFATKTVNVQLPASGHAGPATDAGDDVVLTSIQTYVQRSGTADAIYGGTVSSGLYNWRQVSGPAQAALQTFDGTAAYTTGDNNVRFTGMETPGVYIFEFTAGNNFGDLGTDQVAITRLGALPVTYAYITASTTGTKNIVSWATSTEVNSDRFVVMRSSDGVNFSVTGTVSARGGAVQTAYSFEDVNPPLGISYYRLSQVDKDGQVTLSKTISVNNRKSGVYIEKYPNPVHDNLSVTVQGNNVGKLQVMVADMQGKTILLQQWQKDQPLLKKVINVAGLQSGIYQVIIIGAGDKLVSTFVKY